MVSLFTQSRAPSVAFALIFTMDYTNFCGQPAARRTTKKTKDPAKVNLIASIVKPGYRLQVKENEFIFLKNAEVQVYELEN